MITPIEQAFGATMKQITEPHRKGILIGLSVWVASIILGVTGAMTVSWKWLLLTIPGCALALVIIGVGMWIDIRRAVDEQADIDDEFRALVADMTRLGLDDVDNDEGHPR